VTHQQCFARLLHADCHALLSAGTQALTRHTRLEDRAAQMASIGVLSPRPMGPAASLDVTALDSLCSGSLDELLAAHRAPARSSGTATSPLSPGHAAGRPRGDPDGEEDDGGVAGVDPVRAAKVRAATDFVKKSWQYKVRVKQRRRKVRGGEARPAALRALL
jgi:hypothetical protein